MRHLAALLALMVLMIFSTTQSNAGATVSWGRSSYSATAEAQLRDRINVEHRRVCGVALANDMRLVTLARWRAADMAINGYFSHADQRGHRLAWFLSHAGIPYRNAGEDLAWNNSAVVDAGLTAYGQFTRSATHIGLIRSCTYDRIGVGTFRKGDRNYFVVEFIQR